MLNQYIGKYLAFITVHAVKTENSLYAFEINFHKFLIYKNYKVELQYIIYI